MDYLNNFSCPQCHSIYPPQQLNQRCTCGSTLLARYDYAGIRENLSKETLQDRVQSIWRYRELLPVLDERNIISLEEGQTPILRLPNLGRKIGCPDLFLKDDSLLPGNSFKARVSSVSISKAKELGAKTVIALADGIEGFVLASYARRAGLGMVLLTSKNSLTDWHKNAILSVGASVLVFDESPLEAERLTERTAEAHGWLNASSIYSPYRLEGKKTIGFEIAEAFSWELPDVIISPVGQGGCLFGIYKALRELQTLGWIPSKTPRMVAVQYAHAAAAVDAWSNRQRSAPIAEADGIITFTEVVEFTQQSYYMTLDAIYKRLGCAVDVNHEEALDAGSLLGKDEGLLCEAPGQIAIAAAKKLAASGWIKAGERVLLYNPQTSMHLIPDYRQGGEQSIKIAGCDILPRELGER